MISLLIGAFVVWLVTAVPVGLFIAFVLWARDRSERPEFIRDFVDQFEEFRLIPGHVPIWRLFATEPAKARGTRRGFVVDVEALRASAENDRGIHVPRISIALGEPWRGVDLHRRGRLRGIRVDDNPVVPCQLGHLGHRPDGADLVVGEHDG